MKESMYSQNEVQGRPMQEPLEVSVWEGEFHPCPNQSISSATKSEPSDKPPQLIKASFTIYKYCDIIFSCILPVNKGILLHQSVFSFIPSKDVLS